MGKDNRVWGYLAIGWLSLVAACHQSAASLPARDHGGDVAVAASSAALPTAAPDPRDAPAPTVDGAPIWTANRDGSAEDNARAHFERNGKDFGAATMDAYVAKAHDFTAHPPANAEVLHRANGDILVYDPKTNTFAVATKDGAPRTMFKPDNGAAYWDQQKAKEAANDN